MSTTSKAAPPTTFFPQRNATPTMRHAAPSAKTAGLFHSRHRHHLPRRKSKQSPDDIKMASQSAETEFEVGVESFDDSNADREDFVNLREARQFDVESTTTRDSNSSDDFRASVSDLDASVSAPSMTMSSSGSYMSTPLPTPTSSRAPSFMQPEIVAEDVAMDEDAAADSPVPRSSWVPYFGKMAKAVVSSGMNMGHPFFEKRKKDSSPTSDAVGLAAEAQAEQVAAPIVPPTEQEVAQISAEDARTERRNAWAAEQQQRVTECARLCSQWPQSGYNQSKWGPHGSRQYYEPQSYANPQLVAVLMARQADLERQLYESSGLHFSCYNRQRSSSQDSEPSLDSDGSPQFSPPSSMTLSADLSAAMESPMIPQSTGELSSAGAVSESPQTMASPDPELKYARSVSELDSFALSMAIDQTMEVDRMAESTPNLALNQGNSQSCGSKRPCLAACDEEDKRRKVDEAMVVDEALESGVIMAKPAATPKTNPLDERPLSASVPDLSSTRSRSAAPAVFGHVVKTSDTHPIIISPFFPSELIPTIARHVVIPRLSKSAPLMLASKIDVPSLLLSFVPPAKHVNTLVPSPVQSAFRGHGMDTAGVQIGNLLLSSCPGKRLRMEGPVKGRGPVCRDLATDLRRIKSEGVGCLVW